MNKIIFRLALMIGSLVIASSVQATFIVDDFSDASTRLTTQGASISTILSTSDFATSRTLALANINGPGGANAIVTTGLLAISAGFNTEVDTTSSYNNAAGFNFSAVETSGSIFDMFAISLISIDQGGIDITLTIDGVSATQSSIASGTIFFAHSLFGDITSVNDIELSIHNNIAVDVAIDSFLSYGSSSVPPAVPEPASLFLLASALAAFGFRQRKQK